jgi:hypothetical protein
VENKLLISTFKGLFYWDGQVHRLITTDYGRSTTWDSKVLYALHYDRLCVFEPSTLAPIRQLAGGKYLKNAHQILYTGGKLYVCNTAADYIEMFDGSKAPVRVAGEGCTGPLPYLNSIWYDRNAELFYLAEHRQYNPPPRVSIYDRAWNKVETIILDFDLSWGDEIGGVIGYGIHNVYVEDNRLWTLCARGVMAYMGLDSRLLAFYSPQKRLHLTPHQVMVEDFGERLLLRGLARTSNFWYIGVSGLKVRAERETGNGEVWMLDSDLEIVDTIYLEGIGQIYDVRVLDERDYAHNELLYPGEIEV